jgi:hypothetical protein
MSDLVLGKQERDLLNWLGEEGGQYGECHGETLDSLIAKGLAQVGGEDTGINNTFIAKGRDIMYRAVTLTAAGLEEFRG